MFNELYSSVTSHPWLYAPAGGVLVFAGIPHFMLRRPAPSAQRRGFLFGVGFIAVMATGVFAAFGYSFVRLVALGSTTFDLVWSVSAIATGALVSLALAAICATMERSMSCRLPNDSTAAKPAMTPRCHAVTLFRRFADWKR